MPEQFGGSAPAGEPDARTYDEMLEDPFLGESDARQIKGEATLGHAAAVLVQRGDQDAARPLLDVIKTAVELDDYQSYDLWLEVASEHRAQFTDEIIERVQKVCIEVSDRRRYGISWVGVREILPNVGPEWRDQLRQQFSGKRPTNQARRARSGPPRFNEDWLLFTNSGELTVYRALKQIQEKDLPSEYTIGIYPLAGGRVPGKTWEPDLLVTYRGRAGVLEIDGPSHNARRAMDLSRDHVLMDTGISFVDRVPVEALAISAELTACLRRFLRRLGETK